LSLRSRANSAIGVGDAAELFVRPEIISLGRDRAELAAADQCLPGFVESLLFDGANSAVLVREGRTRTEFRIALSQTGRYADLREGENVVFGFDPQRAICFRVVEHAAKPHATV